MARYLRAHKDGGSWYQRWIPEELRAYFDNRKVIKRYVPQMAPTAADKVARGYAYQDDQEFAAWLRIPAESRAAIAAAGPRAAELRELVANEAPLKSIMGPARLWHPVETPDGRLAVGRPYTAEETDAVRMKAIRYQEDNREELAGLAPLALQAAPAAEHTFDALYKLWLGKGCKRTATHARAARYLAEHLGNVDYRFVTKKQMHGFRNWLLIELPGKAGMQGAIMNAVKGMYTEAIDHGDGTITDNPAHKVSVRVEKTEAALLTGSQIKAILAKAEATKWGGKRHAEAMLLLRLATFQGLRINEIAQLRRTDVDIWRGVGERIIPYLHIREGEDQSLKTGKKVKARKVPLHPACGDFLSFAKRGPGEFVFGAFPDNPSNGRAFWIIAHFHELRDLCGIPAIIDGLKVSQKSLRKSYHRAMSDARLHPDAQRFLMGRAGKDAHDQHYNTTQGLELLAREIADVDPLAIED